ncbi:MAG TPA: aminotransferase class V-fold PLP-dependent enzyme [Gemmatimonadaceae bacterium]|nr:aminotransferase class V-fold PLP-dependent enzyme [Gemmatimonadaceae bacterium]
MHDVFSELRGAEFGRLDAEGHVYLDHTGSALYPDRLVRAHAELLRRGVFGNPHSRSPSSRASTEIVELARRRVLEFFRADPREYEAIFTSNASHSLKLVGEAYPFAPGSMLRLTADNHNSVNGIREFARAHDADFRYLPLGAELRVADLERELAGADSSRPNLFAYPAQSNFSGVQHPLEWIALAHELGYDVLLDAAAFVPTSRLDLGRHAPDFVAISFYKMFGFPTGVGALLARRAALARLHRPWFGGGTVRFASAQNAVHIPYRHAAAFEDGTPNFLSLAGVCDGLDFLEAIGVDAIHDRVMALGATLLEALLALRHDEGGPMVRVYGPCTMAGRGATFALNLLDARGALVDCRMVEAAAAASNISLRTGYFCNPGAAETSFELPADEAARCFAELEGDGFTLHQFSACLHDRPVGAVRLSLGLSSTEADLRRGVEFLAGCARSASRSVSATAAP